MDEFVNQEAYVGPFGTGPWPCLNKAAEHYGESVIPSVEITTLNQKFQLVHLVARVALFMQEKVLICL